MVGMMTSQRFLKIGARNSHSVNRFPIATSKLNAESSPILILDTVQLHNILCHGCTLKPVFSAETDGSTNCCHCCSCQSTRDSGPADISNGHISVDGSMCYETTWCGTVIAIWIHYCKIWFINTLDDKACLAHRLCINRCQSSWQNSVFVHCK